jgi:hypothetical protein
VDSICLVFVDFEGKGDLLLFDEYGVSNFERLDIDI